MHVTKMFTSNFEKEECLVEGYLNTSWYFITKRKIEINPYSHLSLLFRSLYHFAETAPLISSLYISCGLQSPPPRSLR